MNRHFQKKLFIIFFIFFGLLGSSVKASSSKVVRVGFFEFEGVNNISADNQLSGFSYDYILALEQYADWNVQFVTGYNLQECQELLKENKIDLIAGLIKTEERRKYFAYSRTSLDYTTGCLLAKKGNPKFAYEDFAAFDNMLVGLVKGEGLNSNFLKYAKEHHFSVRIKYYQTYKDALNAVENEEIDAFAGSMELRTDKCSVIAYYSPVPCYFIVNKNNQQLLNELNDALVKIKVYSPRLEEILRNKHYYHKNDLTLNFTKEEKAYLAEKKIHYIISESSAYPFEYFDPESQQFAGIIIDLCQKVSEKSGLKFEFITATDAAHQLDVDSQKNQVRVSIYDLGRAIENNVWLTQPLFNSPYVKISKKNSNSVSSQILALSDSHFQKRNFTEKHQMLFFPTMEECLDAIQKGDADFVVINSYEANYYFSLPQYRNLQLQILKEAPQQLSFAISKKSDPRLFSIISKSLQNISLIELTEILEISNKYQKKYNFKNYIYENYVQFILIFIFGLFVFCLILFLIYLVRLNNKKNKSLEAANKGKSDFLSRISHDIRTPLNVVLSYSDEQIFKVLPKNEAKLYLEKINRSGKYLLSLINDVLDMSKLEKDKMVINKSSIMLYDLIDRIIELMRPEMEAKKINFELVAFDEDLRKIVELDEIHVQQVLMNLLNNAVKFSPKNGKIKFSLKILSKNRNIVHLKFSVYNSGSYIPSEMQKKIFEPFEQGKNSLNKQGAGLGLAIAQRFMQLMDGTIKVESSLKKGTTFTIEFNARLLMNEEYLTQFSRIELNQINFAKFRNKHILLVEDNETNVEIVEMLLKKVGIIVDVAPNGQIAYEKFFHSTLDFYDLILMDIRMPVLDGLAATKKIRSLQRIDAHHVPILALTANAFVEEQQASLAAGMNDHLIKPIEVKQLYQILDNYLNKR